MISGHGSYFVVFQKKKDINWPFNKKNIKIYKHGKN